jgi:hypothetical protein
MPQEILVESKEKPESWSMATKLYIAGINDKKLQLTDE